MVFLAVHLLQYTYYERPRFSPVCEPGTMEVHLFEGVPTERLRHLCRATEPNTDLRVIMVFTFQEYSCVGNGFICEFLETFYTVLLKNGNINLQQFKRIFSRLCCIVFFTNTGF